MRKWEIQIFGTVIAMDKDDFVSGLFFRYTSLFVSQMSAITELNSWRSNKRTFRCSNNFWWWRYKFHICINQNAHHQHYYQQHTALVVYLHTLAVFMLSSVVHSIYRLCYFFLINKLIIKYIFKARLKKIYG